MKEEEIEKKTFTVEIPLNAKIIVTVEADTEEEAIKKAIAECDLQIDGKSKLGYEIEEWDIYEKMLECNFWNGIIYQASAEEY